MTVLAAMALLGAAMTAAAASTAAQAPVTIRDGDRMMVPGDFDVLRFDVEQGAEIVAASWDVDVNNVVIVDAATGRIDAIGAGEATVSLEATDAAGGRWVDTIDVSVAAGPAPIVTPVAALQNGNRPDFMMGADVSSLYQVMKAGKKYYDLEGNEAHPLDILAEHGVNWVRLRVWNDPADPFGNLFGGGNATIDTTIELAKQAKERGMKVNVVFHYSDFWAHPGQQRRPAAWSQLTGQPLVDALGAFTTESLIKMRDAGVYPDMVTIGNETNSNIVDVNLQLNAQGNMNPVAVAVFKAGSAAVRSTDPNADDPERRAMVSFHLANGNNASLYNNFTLALQLNGVDYDALGASFYPSWHGTAAQVRNNLNNITATRGIFTYIAETAYPWTLRENAGDDTPQNFKHGDVSTLAVAASPQGQATALRDVIEVAAGINDEKGLGIMYWEPAWLAGPTNGWAAPYGTGWETAGLFDVNGHVLPSVQTFSLVRGDQEVPEDADAWSYGWETWVTVNQGATPTMPTTVLAVKNNGRMGNAPGVTNRQPVVWNAGDLATVDVNTPGEYVVFGSVAGIPDNAFAHVVVRESAAATAVSPTFSLDDGSALAAAPDGYSHSARQPVQAGSFELATETANAGIFFTVDGSAPQNGAGSTLELAGSPWVRQHDSIRVYAGPIEIAQNVQVRAVAARMGYNYVSGQWGTDATLLGNSPEVSRRYKAVYDYGGHYLVNGGFEDGDLTGWSVTGDADTAGVVTPEDWVTEAYAGDHSFALSLAGGQSVTLSQDVLIPNGEYDLTVFARGDNQTDGATAMSLTATAGGEEYTAEVRTINVPGGRMIWRQYTVEGIEVTDYGLGISFDAGTTGSYSGFLDHFVLRRAEAPTDPEAAAAALREAVESIDLEPAHLNLVRFLDRIDREIAAGNQPNACRAVDQYQAEIDRLANRRPALAPDQAALLTHLTNDLSATLGCP